MAQIGMPINGAVYAAEDAGIWFYGRTNGVFAADDVLKVTPDVGMYVNISPGGAWLTPSKFRGIAYANTEPTQLQMQMSDNLMNRIDRVVIRWNMSQIGIHPFLMMKTGTPSYNPQPPAIERSDTVWELALADIRVNAGAIAVTPQMIIDQRPNREICGFVTDGAEQLTMTEVNEAFQQFLGQMEDIKNEFADDFDEFESETRTKIEEFEALITQFEKDISTFNAHVEFDQVTDEKGVHGFRYYNGMFQWFDKNTQTWIEIEVKADLGPFEPGEPTPWITTDGSEQVQNFRASPMDGQVALNWEEPTSPDWVRTIIVRKVGSSPNSETDGITVTVNDTRNARAGFPFYDTDVTNGTTYFYRAFTFNNANQVSRILKQHTQATPNNQDRLRYGVRVWDNEQNPAMERLYDAVGMVANAATVTQSDIYTKAVRNDFDYVYPFSGMSDELVGVSTMVKIPKFYVKFDYQNEQGRWYREWVICKTKYDNTYQPHPMFLKDTVAWTGNNPESDYCDYIHVGKYITTASLSGSGQGISVAGIIPTSAPSTQNQATYRNAVTNNNSGSRWRIWDWMMYNGIWILFHIVFANRNSRGLMGGATTHVITGQTAGALSHCVGLNNAASQSIGNSFYGLENLWGNLPAATNWTMVDGLTAQGSTNQPGRIYYQLAPPYTSPSISAPHIDSGILLPPNGNVMQMSNGVGAAALEFLWLPVNVGGTVNDFYAANVRTTYTNTTLNPWGVTVGDTGLSSVNNLASNSMMYYRVSNKPM